ASAGSGKTTVLVKEYIKLILTNPSNFSKILAISFTNKAANEMKMRIINTLKQLSLLKNPNIATINQIVPELIDNTQENNTINISQIPQYASKALTHILHNYSNLAISTIDSFAYKIVKFFSSDLFLSYDFNIELDENTVIKKIVKQLINKAGEDNNLTDFFIEYSLYLIEDEKNWNIEQELTRFATIIFKEDAQLRLNDLKTLSLQDFKNIKNDIIAFNNKIKKQLINLGTEACKIIEANNLTVNDFHSKKNGIGGLFFKLAKLNNNDKLPNELSETIKKNISTETWYAQTTDTHIKNTIDGIKNELQTIANEIIKIYSNEILIYNFYEILLNSIHKVALISEIEKIFEELKQVENFVHISEFNKKIADIVLKESVPYIYERLGNHYKNFFIDEFQDTSILQWLNFLPLIQNSLAENNFNLIVGDAKQAIYRWRNGKVEQFIMLPNLMKSNTDEILKQREQTLKIHYKENKYLPKNYRSSKTIVNFNNELFNYLKDFLSDEYKIIYNDVQQIPDKQLNGKIEIEFIPSNLKISEIKNAQKQKIKEKIQQLKNLNFQLKDIAILVRDNVNASDIASYLTENNINVISPESLLIKNSDKVKFLINIAKFINDPNNNEIACAACLQYLYSSNKIKTVDNNLLNYTNLNKNSFNEILIQNNILINFYNLITLPVYNFFEELIRTFNFANPPNPFIQYFLEQVFEFSNKEKNSLNAFLTYWEENKNKFSIELPEQIEAVRIMTIHKAKGLQFPAVILPFYEEIKKTDILWLNINDNHPNKLMTTFVNSNKKLLNTKYKDVFIKEMEKKKLDILNLFYVAMTRAENFIYIVGSNYSPDTSKNNIVLKNFGTMLINFLKHKNNYNEQHFLYEFGEITEYIKDNKNLYDNNTIFIDKIISEPSNYNIKIKQHWSSNNDAIEWGKLIHKVLSLIKENTNNEDIIKNFAAKNNLDDNIVRNLNTILTRINNNETLKKLLYNGQEFIIEKDILDTNGNTYRPDRIIIMDNEVTIIDFKTGHYSSDDKTQIETYAYLLRKMGYKVQKKYLIYLTLQNEEIIEC
ncbi:MAG TPA: UvrD-helicase domain-containing protein, partial [Bacteroidales bacterium]|nr:UvrD-helicase domain-containing protein [Bacteroidales bacterium]